MSSSPGRIDISEQVEALLAQLGFPNKSVVTEIQVGIREVTVLYYPLAADGRKHLAGDGHPATRWRKIRVTT